MSENYEENYEQDNEENNDDTCIDIELDEIIIGIDLGTSNTCCGVWRNENLEIIPDERGNRTIPSIVAYTNVSRYIGLDAKNQKELNPANVFYESKRVIGRKIDDPLVKREKDLFSYTIEGDEIGNIVFVSDLQNKKTFTPEEISAAILTKVKQMATDYLRQKVSKCVITIPAMFNDGQRQATKDAAKIAGLECVRIINEPTAAALAYGLLQRTQKTNVSDEENKKTVIVYDFGGGTLDVSLLEIQDGIFEVLSSCGNTRIGGSDFDNRLMDYCINKFKRQNNIREITQINSLSLQKLRTSCEQAKKILSSSMKTTIAVKNFMNEKDLIVQITRNDFEKICMDLFLVCLKPIEDTLKKCDLTTDDIDEIILVGGMTRMPKIRDLIKSKFNGKNPNCSINPEEAVAAGASIQGFLLSHRNDPFSEAVTLLDTTSLSLGVETVGGVMDVLIDRGTVIPAVENKLYSTDTDYVESVVIKIYEGERSLTKDNFFVGEFELFGIEPQIRGIPEIDVTFNVDINGIITVTAENTKTNDKTGIVVTSNKGRLTAEQLNELIEEAKELEFKDALEKRKKYMHYELDDFCYNILMNIKNKEFKLSNKDKEIIVNDITKVVNWLKEKSYDEREDEEYEKITETIKKQYGVLILKGNLESTVVKERCEKNEGTSLYGNDSDNSDDSDNDDKYDMIITKMEDEELGFKGLSEPEKAELKELRQAINDLCYSIIEIMSSGNMKISKEHTDELKYYIDDSLLWLHVHNKPTRAEYKMKIDEINEQCDKIFNHYKKEESELFEKNELISSNKNKRDELENLCLVLKLMLNDGAFPINKNILNQFEEKINQTIEWINTNDDNNDKNEEEYMKECEDKIIEVNNLCEDIHQKMQGINFDENRDIFGETRTILKDYTETNANESDSEDECGTNVIDILRKKQESLIDELLDQENDESNNESNEN